MAISRADGGSVGIEVLDRPGNRTRTLSTGRYQASFLEFAMSSSLWTFGWETLELT